MWPYLLILLTSCSVFIKDKTPETAKGSQYTVKFASVDWLLKKDDRSDYVFENQKDGRILLSNSFCKEFQDEPLDELAKKTFRSLADYKKINSLFKPFQHREAYFLEGRGNVDGVLVDLRLLNTRRNNCYFDFVGISPVATSPQVNTDFEAFINSVEFK
jgi:hypothetical protein